MVKAGEQHAKQGKEQMRASDKGEGAEGDRGSGDQRASSLMRENKSCKLQMGNKIKCDLSFWIILILV